MIAVGRRAWYAHEGSWPRHWTLAAPLSPAAWATQGDGWRVTPNPTPPDTSPEDLEWISNYLMPQSVKCFDQPLCLQAELSLPCAYIHWVGSTMSHFESANNNG
jgi:hypothetical protein